MLWASKEGLNLLMSGLAPLYDIWECILTIDGRKITTDMEGSNMSLINSDEHRYIAVNTSKCQTGRGW